MSVPATLQSLRLKTAPTGPVQLEFGHSDSTFEEASTPFSESDLQDSFVLLKVLYLSNDPAQRPWIQKGTDASRQYIQPVREGDAMRSLGVGEIVLSKSSKFEVGQKVVGAFSWSDYAIVNEAAIFNIIDESKGLPLPVYLSVLGMTGMTAYFGLTDAGQFKDGQTVLVSAAAGATGSMVVQIAKHLFKDTKVIGLAGTPEKCKWVESLGADVCVNYHDSDYQDQLSKIIGSDYVDVYFDNVGGEILNFALTKIKRGGRVAACGAISGYNDPAKGNVSAWGEIISNRLTIQGFIVSDYTEKVPQAVGHIVQGVTSGKIQIAGAYHVEDVSQESKPLSKVPGVWSLLFGSSKPNGKLVTKLA